jgi:hypothetical protein
LTFLVCWKFERWQVQAKAQEEVDRVLKGRIPAFDDLANLPYIRNVLKEVPLSGVISNIFKHALTAEVPATYSTGTFLGEGGSARRHPPISF